VVFIERGVLRFFGCGGCCCWGCGRGGGYDGKALFSPIDAQYPNNGHDDEDDSSSSSGTNDEEDGNYGKYVY